MEIELKLLLAPDDAQALRQHRLLGQYATSKPHEQSISDIYFDTPDLHIRHGAAGLRVRRVDHNDWVQTLKTGGGVDGDFLHCRHEWKSRVTGPQPDLALLRTMVDHKSAWGRLLRSPVIEDNLLAIFNTQVQRMVWELRLPQGDEIEFSLDRGNLELMGQKVAINEIELKLKSGEPAHLFDFALALQQDIPMQIGNLSKANRGYALFAPQPPAAVKARLVQLSKSMTIEQAFRAIVFNCMAQIQANQTGVAQERDVESLHQMRVGLRRLRSALGLFKGVLQASEDVQGELNWLATQLGAARDWDVLADSTLFAVAATAPDQMRLHELELAARDRASEQHEAAAAAVDAPRYTRLILCCARWVHGYGWRDAMSPQDRQRLMARVSEFAHDTLVHAQRRLLKRGGQLRGASPAARHRVRIAAKKARYATEFFQALYSSKKVHPYVAALSGLQDELGWLNDAAVADRLLKELQNGQTHIAASAGFARGYLVARIENDDKRILTLWKKFARMPLPCQQ